MSGGFPRGGGGRLTFLAFVEFRGAGVVVTGFLEACEDFSAAFVYALGGHDGW